MVFLQETNTLNSSLEVYHLQIIFTKQSIKVLSPKKKQKMISIDQIHILS